MCILAGVALTLAKPKINSKKGKKKKDANTEMSKLVEPFNAMIDAVNDSLATLENIIDSMSKVMEVEKLSAALHHKFSQIRLSVPESKPEVDPAHAISMDDLQDHIAKGVDSSYEFSFWQFRGIIKKKFDYLASIRLWRVGKGEFQD